MPKENELHQIEVAILLAIARSPKAPTYDQIQAEVGMNSTPSDHQKFQHYLKKLGFENRDLIEDNFSSDNRDRKTVHFFLTDAGRGYLVDNNLI